MFSGNPLKLFVYFLFIPISVMSITLFILIELRIGVDPDSDSLWLTLIFTVYGLTVGIVLIAVAVFTIVTWRRAHDNIFVRGELVCQELILIFGLMVLFVIYNMDRHEFTPENERYDSMYYFGYFVTLTVMAFSSLLVSTLWLPIQELRSIKLEMSETNSIIFSIDLPSVLSLDSGIQAFLSHLARENLINHFAVQLTI